MPVAAAPKDDVGVPELDPNIEPLKAGAGDPNVDWLEVDPNTLLPPNTEPDVLGVPPNTDPTDEAAEPPLPNKFEDVVPLPPNTELCEFCAAAPPKTEVLA